MSAFFIRVVGCICFGLAVAGGWALVKYFEGGQLSPITTTFTFLAWSLIAFVLVRASSSATSDPMSDSQPSRWVRFFPNQFSLRTLLVLFTVSMLIWWLRPPSSQEVFKWNAASVKVGMTQQQVEDLLRVKVPNDWTEATEDYVRHHSKFKVWNPFNQNEALRVSFDYEMLKVVAVRFEKWQFDDREVEVN